MTLRSNDLRFAFIAFVAVVGMLSSGGDATAQSTTSAGAKSRPQLLLQPRLPSGLLRGRKTASPLGTSDRLASLRPAQLMRPHSSCMCNPDEPASPASRQESLSAGSRPAEHVSEVASLPIPVNASRLLTRLSEPDLWPPGSPLYLTTARLLI